MGAIQEINDGGEAMTAIILCPGESLASYKPKPADLVLAVNRAALQFECDVFCALDYPMIRDNGPNVLGNPALLSKGQTIRDVGPQRLARFAAVHEFPMPITDPPGLKHQCTMVAAILFAARTCNRIEVCGCDMAGTKDYDGVEAGEDRTEWRWGREREAWDTLVPWLNERGVSLERMLHNVTFHHPV
jgi:hypothetical protein